MAYDIDPTKTRQPNSDRLKVLYDALKEDGADVGDSWQFRAWMMADENNRKTVWQAFKDDGADVGEYDEFDTWLYDLGQQPTAATHPTAQQPTQRNMGTPGVVPNRFGIPTQQQGGTGPVADAAPHPMTPAQPLSFQERVQKSVGMAHNVGKAKADFSQRMSAIEQGNKPFSNGKAQQYDPTTGETKDVYYTTTGQVVSTPMERDVENIKNSPETKEREGKIKVREQIGDMTSEVSEALNQRGMELDDAALHNTLGDRPMGGGAMVHTFNSSTSNGRLSDERWRMLYSAKVALDRANEMMREANTKGGVHDLGASEIVRGMGKVGNPDTWDMGLTEGVESTAMMVALQKADNGEELTREEQLLLDAKAVEMATAMFYASDLSGWYKAGEVTADALPFMLEMMINPAAKVGRSAQSMLTRYALKRFGKQALKRGGEKFIKGGLRRFGGRAGIDLLGASYLTTTSSLPRVGADAISRMNGDVQFNTNEEGNIQYAGHTKGEDWWSAWSKGYLSTLTDNYSEMLGEYFAPLFKWLGKGIGRGATSLADTKFGKWLHLGGGIDKVEDFIKGVSAHDMYKFISDLEENAQWHGILGEYAEEVVGGIMNAILVGDQTLDADPDTGVFNLKKNLETLQGVAVMGGFFSAMKTVGYRNPAHVARRAMRKADRAGASAFGEQWESIRSMIDGGQSDAFDDTWDGMTDNQKQAILDYTKASYTYKGIAEGKAKRDAEGVQTQQEAAAEQSYNTGYDDATTDELRSDINLAYTDARQKLVELIGEDAVNAIDSDPLAMQAQYDQDMTVDDNTKYAIADYVSAKSAWDGVQQRISDDAADRADQRRAEGERMAYKGKGDMQGMLRPLTISEIDPQTGKRKKKTVYLVNGNIAIEPNNGLSREGTDKTIYVYDPETGDTHELDPFAGAGVLEVGEPVSMEDYLADNEQQSQAEVQQAAETAQGKVKVNTPFETPQGRKGVVQSIEGDNAIVLFADGEMEQASMPLAEVQQYADALRRQEYEARHPQQTPAEQPQQPNTATEGQNTVGAEVAAEYLLGSGANAINSTDYLIKALSGIFSKAQSSIEAIRQKYQQQFAQEPYAEIDNFVKSDLYEQIVGEVRNAINAAYGSNSIEAQSILDEILKSPKGLPNRTGQDISRRVESLNAGQTAPQEGSQDPIVGGFTNKNGKRINFRTRTYEKDGVRYTEAYGESDGREVGTRAYMPMPEGLQPVDLPEGTTIVGLSQLRESSDGRKAGTLVVKYADGGLDIADVALIAGGNATAEQAQSGGMPMKKDGNPDFMATTPQQGFDYIYNDAELSPEEAQEYIKANTDAANKALESVQKKAPKMSNNLAKYKQERAAWQKKLAAAQAEVEYWQQLNAIGQQTDTEVEAPAQQPSQAGEVPDMSVDKASDARARGYRLSLGNRYDRQESTDGVEGSETEVKFANSEKPVKGRWKVMEADKVQPSHMGDMPNPMHFIPEAQPKDRTDDVSGKESDKIAAKINPKEIIDGVTAYTGAPVVNGRGEVIQGNNRAIALRKMSVYAESSSRYKQYLIDHAADYGLNAEDIAKMQNPVMVREVDVSDEEAIRLGQFTASDTESGGKERISAEKVLGKLTDEQTSSMLNIMLRGGEETDEMTVSQLIDRNGGDVLTYLAGQGAVSETQVQSAYGRDGRMTPEAKNDLADLVTQNIFKGGADNIKSVWEKYMPVAAQKALLQAMAGDMRLPVEDRLIKEVRNAIMAVGEIKNNPFTKDAKTAEEYHKGLDMDARQADMLSRPIKERYSELEIDMAVRFLTTKQNALKAIFGEYQRYVTGTNSNLFEEAQKMSRAEAIEKTFGIKGNNQQNVTGKETETLENGGGERGTELGHGERPPEGEPGGAATGAGQPGTAGQAQQPAVNPAYAQTEEEYAEIKAYLDEHPNANVSELQRKLKLGYNRATLGKQRWESERVTAQGETPAAGQPRAAVGEKEEQSGKAVSAVLESTEKIEDFGEKIGMARKDTATKGIKRGVGEMPAWKKKYRRENVTPEELQALQSGKLSFSQLLSSPAHMVQTAFDPTKPFVGFYVEEPKTRWGSIRYYPIKDAERNIVAFNSEAEYEAALPVFEVSDQGYRVVEKNGKYKIVRRASNGKQVEYAEFDTREDAEAYMVTPEGATSLLNRKRENFELPALESLTRNGMKDWRKGRNITSDDMLQTFGFRGGEFGNWLNAEERQQFLNTAYDALMDLAEALGVSPRALSLGGALSIAFGARGRQGARAHYEPSRAVINLTKMKGAGSLAHEWAHALDNYFGMLKAGKEREHGGENDKWVTSQEWARNSQIRMEIDEIFTEIVNTMKRKTVTRQIDIDKAQADVDKKRASFEREVKAARSDYERGVTKLVYNRKTKERERQTIKPTEQQLAEFDRIMSEVTQNPQWEWDEKKQGFRLGGELGKQFYELVHDVMPNTKGAYGPANNVFYFADKLAKAEAYLEQAKNGESETVRTKTDFLEGAEKADKGRAGSYYTKDLEMFARAFETYLAYKMAASGRSSDYLTYKKGEVFKSLFGFTPYPEGEELSALTTLFDKLFSTMQEYTDEQGNVIPLSKRFNKRNADIRYEKVGDNVRFRGEEEPPLQITDENGTHDVVKLTDIDAFTAGTYDKAAVKKLADWLKENKDTYVRLYHGTSSDNTIETEGIRRTNNRNKHSYQSQNGYVYLSIYPSSSRLFGELGSGRNGEDVSVYAVDVKVKDLLPDTDQLNNKRAWGGEEFADMGNSLAESILYGSGARVKRDILPSETSKTLFRNLEESDNVVNNADAGTRPLTDREKIAKLESEPKVKVYRSMQLIDGKLYPPMSARVDGQLREPSEIGVWEEAEEHPELADENGKFKLDKGNKKSLKAAYNPYIHTSRTMLNDQFSEAQSRPNLVVVEVEIPESELNGTYRAEKAKDSVGAKQWKAGVIQGQLSGTREVILSRWAKPVRIVPDAEVAENIARQIEGQVSVMPSNVVTPQVRAELEKRGVRFVETDNTGRLTSGSRKGETWAQVYGKNATKQREGGEEANAGEWYDRGSVERIGEFAGYSPKRIAKMNARQEESARKQFNETAEKLHLSDNITFADSIDDVPGLTDEEREERRDKKGWYDIKTGKIVIILGNHKSMDDVMKSILHEGVAHHGLRQMFGEHFNTFLDNVYQNAHESIRDEINAMAKKHGWNFREATEEYLAKLAEDTDFEKPQNQSWWGQVKQWFFDMLHKIGFKLHDAYDTITDNELRYVLWRSYQNLVNPGRFNSVVEEAKDVAKQYELKVGQWDETWTAAEAEPNATIEYNGRKIPVWAGNGRRENRADRVERNDRMGSDYNVAADGVAEDAAEYAQRRRTAEAIKERFPEPLTMRNYKSWEVKNYLAHILGMGGWINDIHREIPYRFLHPEPTLDDYFKDTKATFKSIGKVPEDSTGYKLLAAERANMRKWEEMKENGKYEYHQSPLSNSEYLVDRETGDIYRLSDHWGQVASCDWDIDQRHGGERGIMQIGKCNISDFAPLNKSGRNNALNPAYIKALKEATSVAKENYKTFLDNVEMTDAVRRDIEGQITDLDKNLEREIGNFGDNDIRFRDGEDEESDSEERESIEQLANNMSIGTSARFAAVAARNAQESHDNAEALAAALNFTSQNLEEIVKATKAQKIFDKATVKQVTDMARVMVSAGYLDSMGRADVKGLLKAIRESTGETDNTDNVNRIIDIMVKNQLKNQENTLATLLKIKGSRVDARGINVQGKLDTNGQQVIKSFKDNMKEQRETIESRIADAEERMTSEDRAIADAAYNEKVGLQLALDYVEKIGQSKADEKDIEAKKRAELSKVYDYTRVVDVDEQGNALFKKDGTERTHEVRHVRAEFKGKISDEKKAERERVEQTAAAMDDAIRHMRMERIDAYTDFIAQVAGNMKESMKRAKAFREADKHRVETIHHLANSDMQGRKLKGQDKDTILDNLSNNVGVRIALSPLMNLDQMLRMFGRQNVDGKGNLWNYYMRGWIDAVDGEQTWKERYMDKLNAKVKELFGKHGYNWLEHYSNTKDGMTVQYWDGTKMKEVEMPQSRMLYIYAVEKMPMGKATNRRMGLTDEDIAIIEDRLDPKLKEFVDWVQSELLPEMGRECDKVHMRMFGAHMDSIENYFPFDRDTNAMPREEENGQERKNNKITVLTGAIKKRTPNVVVWDMKSCNIFDVLTRHIEEMSHWANFAELNRDFGTLESYNRFKQQVMAMATVYGSGNNLWNNFMEVCAIATDAYDPRRGEFDKNASLVLKGVAMGKVSLRPFTAIKQILSQPAFWGEANPIYMIEDLASLGLIPWYGIKDKNPENCFMWAWRNMPNFRKRVVSRTTGNFYLQDTEYDKQKLMGKIMEKTKWGMLPNIGVDAWTIAIGSHAVYRTNKDKYLRQGLGEREAERRAIQDAELCFNKSQQSSEGAFMAPMQIDHTVAAGTAMIFRNASTSYTREWLASGRQLKRLVSGEVNAEAMAKQILRARNSAYLDGEISSEELQKVMPLAKRELRTGIVRQSVNHIMFGWVLPWLWRIGGLLPLFLLSGDDDEKKKRWEEAKKQSLFGPVEGFLYGDVQSDVINKLVGFSDKDWKYIGRQNPTLEDAARIKEKLGYDPTAAITDALGLLVGMCTGINPQTIVDWATAIVDKTSGDRALSREGALFAARLLNCPPSQLDQIYFDEIEMTGTEASNYTIDELVDRWAEYKTRNSHMGLMPEKALEKTKKRGYKIIEEKVGNMSDEALAEKYDRSGITGKARVGKVVADRLSEEHGIDLKDSYGSGNALNSKYGKIYAQHRTYIDMAEDMTLNAEIKRLTAEKERLESIGAYGKLYNETINKLEDLKDVKNTEIPSYKRNMVNELGNPMSEEVINAQMENIRKARRRVLYPEQAANPTDNVEE